MKTVLVVDDDMGTQEIYRTLLKSMNIDVLIASDMNEALLLLQQTKPDLIIMDLLLPNISLSGLEAIPYLKQHPVYRHIPIIATTAADKTLLKKTHGYDGVIFKPTALTTIRQQVLSFLEQSTLSANIKYA